MQIRQLRQNDMVQNSIAIHAEACPDAYKPYRSGTTAIVSIQKNMDAMLEQESF